MLSDAFDLASRGQAIVTIGIKPTEPATGYGYIRVGEALPPPTGVKAYKTVFHRAEQFVEKPNFDTALGYLQQRPVSLERGHVHLVVRDGHRRFAEASAGNVRRVPALVQSREQSGEARKRCWRRNIPTSKKSRLISR